MMSKAFSQNWIWQSIHANNFHEVREIYRLGIETANATFETQVPDWEPWDKSHLPFARLSAYVQNQMAGWTALSAVSDRCVYQGVAELSIYIHPLYQQQGLGYLMMQRLINESETHGIWSLMSGVFPENIASRKLHASCGFREIGIRERIGKMNGQWRDTLLLQRRSKIIGID